jgi:predicted Rossmann fold flavoprotein
MANANEKFDVVVIGSGPAGMMAAGKAAECGLKVALIEKNSQPGKKLLITGNGRCNITQATFNPGVFIDKLACKKSRFLHSAISLFGPKETIDFFEHKGLKTKTEKDGRVFPITDKSTDVLNVLLKYLKDNKVSLYLQHKVLNFNRKNGKIESIDVSSMDGEIKKIIADNFVIATGGKTYAITGSTGDGYHWAETLGHKINKIRPSLAPIKTKEEWVRSLQGISLKNIKISAHQNNRKIASATGSLIFTHFGLSGPVILNISREISSFLDKGEINLFIDLFPDLNQTELDSKILKIIQDSPDKNLANNLSSLLPKKLVDIALSKLGIEAEMKTSILAKKTRLAVINWLKKMPLTATGLVGFDQAMVTRGGIDVSEIDSKTMRSKIVENLYFAGEIIDLDGPTGGYNLQICWSTGYLAGKSVAGLK